MAYPQFDGFELNDINATGVITSNVRKFSNPSRSIEIERVARRPGGRLLNDEFTEKIVLIEGYVIGDSEADLRSKIDALNTSVNRKTDGQLAIAIDRTATAIVSKFEVNENPYNTDFVEYRLECTLPDPFFYAGQHTVTFTLASGVATHTENITISGSYFASPVLTITVAGGSGDTQTERIDIQYLSTAETVIWSGGLGESNLDYADILQFDYNSQLITRNSSANNSSGAFADFDPGSRNLKITFSGVGDWVGGTASFSYQPRYL